MSRVVLSIDMLRPDWADKYFSWFKGRKYLNHSTFSAWTVDVFTKVSRFTDKDNVVFLTDNYFLYERMRAVGFKNVWHSTKVANLQYFDVTSNMIIHYWGPTHNVFNQHISYDDKMKLLDERLSRTSKMVKKFMERNEGHEFVLTADHGVIPTEEMHRAMKEGCLHVPFILYGADGEVKRFTSHRSLGDWVSGGNLLDEENWQEIESTVMGLKFRWGNDWKVEHLGTDEPASLRIR